MRRYGLSICEEHMTPLRPGDINLSPPELGKNGFDKLVLQRLDFCFRVNQFGRSRLSRVCIERSIADVALIIGLIVADRKTRFIIWKRRRCDRLTAGYPFWDGVRYRGIDYYIRLPSFLCLSLS